MNNKIILLIIVIVAVLAGVFYLLRAPGEKTGPPPPPPAGEVSASDAVPVLQQEVQTTETEDLDKEFADIEAEINAALGE